MMRDFKIDLLRFVGLLMIILAHVEPPELLLQIRNFDVPLMIFVSGMSFSYAFQPNETYKAYIWKRIKRLVFPVWIFLTLYFSLVFIFSPSSIKLEFKTIVDSYLLIDGIGYVWIIRVFLLVAMVSPFLYHINKKIRNDTIFLISIILIYGYIRAY